MDKVTFIAVCVDGNARIMTGWPLRDGAVMHRELTGPGNPFRDLWVVSDPVSGARFLKPCSMGRALRAYRALVASYGGGWEKALAGKQKRVLEEWRAIKNANAEVA